MNISAEQKAELMRQAMQKRDNELRDIEIEKATTEEASDAAKEKLDWQKEYVDALLENLSILKEIKDKGKADETTEPVDFTGTGGGGGIGLPTQDKGEEKNPMSDAIAKARTGFDYFKQGLTGKAFGEGEDPADMRLWKKLEPEEYNNAKNLYDTGKKVFDIWNKIAEGPIGKLLGISSNKGGGQQKAQSPVIQQIQQFLDYLTSLIDLAPLADALFQAFNSGLQLIGTIFGILIPEGVTFQQVLQFIGTVLGGLIEIIVVVAAALINGLVTALTYGITFLTATFEFARTIVSSIYDFVSNLIGGFVDLFSGNMDGVREHVHNMWLDVKKIFEGLVDWLKTGFITLFLGFLDTLLTTLGTLVGGVAQVLGKVDFAASAKQWIEDMKKALADAWVGVNAWFEQAKQDVIQLVCQPVLWGARAC